MRAGYGRGATGALEFRSLLYARSRLTLDTALGITLGTRSRDAEVGRRRSSLHCTLGVGVRLSGNSTRVYGASKNVNRPNSDEIIENVGVIVFGGHGTDFSFYFYFVFLNLASNTQRHKRGIKGVYDARLCCLCTLKTTLLRVRDVMYKLAFSAVRRALDVLTRFRATH